MSEQDLAEGVIRLTCELHRLTMDLNKITTRSERAEADRAAATIKYDTMLKVAEREEARAEKAEADRDRLAGIVAALRHFHDPATDPDDDRCRRCGFPSGHEVHKAAAAASGEDTDGE